MNALETTSLAVPKEQFLCLEFLRGFVDSNFSAQANGTRSYEFFWARNALYYALKALGISKGAQVLLPAYLCRAAVEPFEAYGCEVRFYGIGRNCDADLSEVESKITARTEAVLAVHYFGFPQRILEFRTICDRHGVALIEDCAHILPAPLEDQTQGGVGDASIFSWRKFLPVYDGGELRLKRPCEKLPVPWSKETIPFVLKVAKSLLDQSFENSNSSVAKGISAAIETLRDWGKKLRRASVDKPLFALDSNSATFDTSLLNQRMSLISRWIRAHSDISAIMSRRRENYLFLRRRLQSTPGVRLLHHNLPDDVCPWVLPLFFEGVTDGHLLLQEYGIPAVNWAGVRSPAVTRGAFPDADFLYDSLIFLPVHQNLRAHAREAIVEAVQKVSAQAT